MFIREVIKYNKWLGAAMILFIAAQLFLDYKHGMVISPFFHYGMYSHHIDVEKNYTVPVIEVDGKALKGEDYSAQQWDKIMMPLQYFKNLDQSNKLYHDEVKRLLAKVHIQAGEEDFIRQYDCKQFAKWYAEYLGRILHQPRASIGVQYKNYTYNGSKLQPSDSLTTPALLCP